MQTWAIVAIVVMCIVFVAILGLYAFLYTWFTRRVNGRVASSNVLYYWDFFRTLQKVELPRRTESIDPSFVLRTIAKDMASIYHRDDLSERNITLARFDKSAQTYVAIDLDILLSVTHRPLFVRQTAFQPLVLLQHNAGGIPKDFGMDGGISPSATPRGSAVSGQTPRGSRGTGRRSRLALEPPPPIIQPTSDVISTETDVVIHADRFVFVDNPGELVPSAIHTMVESGLKQPARSIVATNDGQTTVIVDPNPQTNGLPLIVVRHARRPPRKVERYQPGSVRYCYGDKLEWHEYTRPFRLPFGRWCVRAESWSPDGKTVRSDSRVYTVEEGFSFV